MFVYVRWNCFVVCVLSWLVCLPSSHTTHTHTHVTHTQHTHTHTHIHIRSSPSRCTYTRLANTVIQIEEWTASFICTRATSVMSEEPLEMVCVWVCMCACVCMSVCMCVHVSMNVSVWTNLCDLWWMCVCMCACVCLCVFIRTINFCNNGARLFVLLCVRVCVCVCVCGRILHRQRLHERRWHCC